NQPKLSLCLRVGQGICFNILVLCLFAVTARAENLCAAKVLELSSRQKIVLQGFKVLEIGEPISGDTKYAIRAEVGGRRGGHQRIATYNPLNLYRKKFESF